MVRKAIVVHSPHSGRAHQLTEALEWLKQEKIQLVDVLPISALDHLPPQGRDWKADGIDLAIAAGGDGLIGGIIYHIAESGIPLGILPLGTANDIARSLHLPQQLPQAVAVIAHGQKALVDIGIAQPAEPTPHLVTSSSQHSAQQKLVTSRQSFFAHALSIGLNVQFAQIATNVAIRQRYGRLTYPLAALEVLKKHQGIEIDLLFQHLALASQASGESTVLLDQQVQFHCRALLVIVINAPLFGGRWQIPVPGATLDDRLLDVVIIEDIDLQTLNDTLLSFFDPHAVDRRQTEPEASSLFSQAELTHLPGLHHVRTKSLLLSTTLDPQDITLDGEIRGQTPSQVTLSEQRLSIMVPSAQS